VLAGREAAMMNVAPRNQIVAMNLSIAGKAIAIRIRIRIREGKAHKLGR
jgi:hypothetical protein